MFTWDESARRCSVRVVPWGSIESSVTTWIGIVRNGISSTVSKQRVVSGQTFFRVKRKEGVACTW